MRLASPWVVGTCVMTRHPGGPEDLTSDPQLRRPGATDGVHDHPATPRRPRAAARLRDRARRRPAPYVQTSARGSCGIGWRLMGTRRDRPSAPPGHGGQDPVRTVRPTTSLPDASASTDGTRGRWLPRDERSLFMLGTALVALHVLDDTLLQPPTGTTAAGHLVSALVPTVLLAAAAVGFGRVRAGGRAVLALSVGMFGIGIGVIEAGTTPPPWGLPATTSPGCSLSPRGHCSSGSAGGACGSRDAAPGGSGGDSCDARCSSWRRPLRRTSSPCRSCTPTSSLMSSVPWCRRTSSAWHTRTSPSRPRTA